MLTVEDGTGKPDADSYAGVGTFYEYAAKVGFDCTIHDAPHVEQALRRATMWIDARYGASFLGCRANIGQALEWPRRGVHYRGVDLEDDVLPTALVSATCEAAIREITRAGSLYPDQSSTVVKRRKVGDVETEFSVSGVGTLPSFPIIDGLLRGLTVGRASGYYGRVARA